MMSKKYYCKNCGNPILDTDKYCNKCGAKLTSTKKPAMLIRAVVSSVICLPWIFLLGSILVKLIIVFFKWFGASFLISAVLFIFGNMDGAHTSLGESTLWGGLVGTSQYVGFFKGFPFNLSIFSKTNLLYLLVWTVIVLGICWIPVFCSKKGK